MCTTLSFRTGIISPFYCLKSQLKVCKYGWGRASSCVVTIIYPLLVMMYKNLRGGACPPPQTQLYWSGMISPFSKVNH